MISSACLQAASDRKATFGVPGNTLEVDISNDSCKSAKAILFCSVPLHEEPGHEWGIGQWKEVDKVHERSTFKALAWLTERVRNDNDFRDWQDATVVEHYTRCERCAPTPPAVKWVKDAKGKVSALERSVQAGKFERALKHRPAPFITQLKAEDKLGNVRIGVNIASLMHRALSRLPSVGRTEKATVSWRLNTDFSPMAKLNVPKFTLASNRSDEEHDQPPFFKVPLRKEQLRSLTWMLQQEAADAPPFIEEEISEAMLESLGWRVEGRAQRPVHIRGGVLADEVGYGKTAITLALIDCTAKAIRKEVSQMGSMPGKIPVRATLVIVPPHLLKQWGSEKTKFIGKERFKVLTLSSAANINSTTIGDVMNADIVIVASNLFKSPVYLQNLSAFAAGGSLPEKQDGRYFNARLRAVLEALGEQVDLLQEDDGPKRVHTKIKERAKQGQCLVTVLLLLDLTVL